MPCRHFVDVSNNLFIEKRVKIKETVCKQETVSSREMIEKTKGVVSGRAAGLYRVGNSRAKLLNSKDNKKIIGNLIIP